MEDYIDKIEAMSLKELFRLRDSFQLIYEIDQGYLGSSEITDRAACVDMELKRRERRSING